MAGSWPDDGRFKRIAEMLQATDKFDVAGFEKMQQDTLSRPLHDLVQSLAAAVKNADPKITRLLQAWDGRVDRDRSEHDRHGLDGAHGAGAAQGRGSARTMTIGGSGTTRL